MLVKIGYPLGHRLLHFKVPLYAHGRRMSVRLSVCMYVRGRAGDD